MVDIIRLVTGVLIMDTSIPLLIFVMFLGENLSRSFQLGREIFTIKNFIKYKIAIDIMNQKFLFWGLIIILVILGGWCLWQKYRSKENYENTAHLQKLANNVANEGNVAEFFDHSENGMNDEVNHGIAELL